jgi:hypothetical protein
LFLLKIYLSQETIITIDAPASSLFLVRFFGLLCEHLVLQNTCSTIFMLEHKIKGLAIYKALKIR